MAHLGSNTEIGHNGQKLIKRRLPTKTQTRHKRLDLPRRADVRTPNWTRNTGTTWRKRPVKQQAKGRLGQWVLADCIQRPHCGRHTLGWSESKSKKPNIPQPGNRRPADLPTTIPPLEHRTNYSIRIGPWTRPFLRTTPQHNVWPLPSLHLQTKAERKTWKFPLPPQSPRRKVRPRICGRRPLKRHFIAFMTNTDIQRELLTETRTAQQVLQFALNRKRGQENQKTINSQLNRYSPHTFK